MERETWMILQSFENDFLLLSFLAHIRLILVFKLKDLAALTNI